MKQLFSIRIKMALAEGSPRSILPNEMGRAVYRSPETVLAFRLMKSGQTTFSPI